MSTANVNPYASPVSVAAPNVTTATGLATRSERFLGALIDSLILLPLNLVLVGGAGFILGTMLGGASGVTFQVGSAVLGLVLGGGLFLLVNGYLLATRGQTVGKVVMKTKIVRDSGEDLPLGELVVKRYLPLWAIAVVPYIGILAALGNAGAIFRENHKCIHDDIAGTKVIKLS